MTAVGLGQQGSQVVGSGFESLSCQTFLRLSLTDFDTRISETLKGPFRNFLRDKKFSTENLDTPPLIQTFSIPEINATVRDSPTEVSAL